ncbi:vitamin B12-dependent ribonucleotide reductase [Candidatus Berkelbacteria bacterium]|nr:vitamin B12-dependent ribonucleotide reductase [Candidatus Berkelbacteria bacterium]
MASKKKDSINDIALQPVEISVDLPKKDEHFKPALKINRKFTKMGEDVFANISWEKRTTIINDEKGNIISQITDVEVPSSWSQLATDILAYKYLRKAGLSIKEGRETSAKQAVYRIAHTMADFGEKFGYFASKEDRQAYEDELTTILITQRAAFNSPVWFNCGLYHQYKIEGTAGSFYWDFKENKVLLTKNAYRNPQCSACFILSVKDTLPGIFELLKTESHIFKYGSGAGANFSPLRSKHEKLSGGGTSSGLMSFLRVFDRGADAVKSGGTTRRAAKMVVVNIDHPEIEDFINWKVNEEKKAKALIAAGYDPDFNGEAYHTVSGQNSNNSVRIPDEFMKAYENDTEWQTRYYTTGEHYKTYKARDLMDKIAEAAWQCADPGVQFDTTVNEWHTCPNTDRINASNPCSEYMFLDDSACNLASINLVKFIDDQGKFDISAYRHACRIMLISQEIAVDLSSYPTAPIAQNSHDYRPLGLGYANLGALLMLRGIPYDSEQGTAVGAALTAIMCGHAYKTSAEIAAVKGPFAGFTKNRAPMLNVMKKHRSAAYKINEKFCPTDLLEAAHQDWDEAVALGEQFGYRNSQVTVIAPTGTIGLLMDCDTTGIEPDFALVKFKKLAGGGSMKILNNSVPRALENLGYSSKEQQEIMAYAIGTGSLRGDTAINAETLSAKGLTTDEIAKLEKALPSAFNISHVFNSYVVGQDLFDRLKITTEQTSSASFSLLKHLGFSDEQINSSNEIICGTQMLEGAPHLKQEHYAVFDCANKCGNKGTRYIEAMGHVRMMAATQPFISGAISKTINLPNDATVADVKNVYIQAWKLGLKALALYRDGSKGSQPLNSKKEEKSSDKTETIKVVYEAKRRRLPDDRKAITHKFNIAGHEGYITVGMYPEGTPGEIFITMAKQGSVISGLMDSFATSISISLQYGIPLSVWVRKLANSHFEPYGFTSNPQIRITKSIVDYVMRFLGLKFLSPEEQQELGIKSTAAASSNQELLDLSAPQAKDSDGEETASQAKIVVQDPLIEGVTAATIEPTLTEVQSDAPPCPNCGSMTVKTGTCYTCQSCGSTTGGCS